MDSSSSYPHDESIDYNDYADDEIHRMIERRNSDDSSSSSIVDSLVDVSKICNTWVVEYCTMCTNYMDKQVQYETNTGIVMSQYVNNAANKATSLLSRPAGTFDLQGSLAGYANCHIGNTTDNVRDMMFDEESVVESIISR